MAVPTFVSDDPTIATVQSYLNDKAYDQAFEQPLLLKLIYKASRMPGLDTPDGKLLATVGLNGADMGKVLKRQSGRQAWMPVVFNSATTVQTFFGADVLKTAIDPVLNNVYSDFAYYTGYVGQTFTESAENSGEEAKMDLLQERTDMALRTMSDTMETDLHSTNVDVSHSSQKSFPGMGGYIATSPSTGTPWGVDRAVYTAWRNQADTCASFASTGLAKMDSMLKSCSGTNSSNPPGLIETTSTIEGYYKIQAQSIHRLTVAEVGSADLGVSVCTYQGIPMVYSGKVAANTMRFINLGTLRFLIQKNAEWQVIKPSTPNDQAIAEQIRFVFGGTWGSTRWNRNGVLTISAA